MTRPALVTLLSLALLALATPSAAAGDTWVDLGDALAGTHGAPVLTGDGPLVAGTTATLTLSNVRAQTWTYAVIGLSTLDLPFFGGTFVPALDLVVPIPTGGTAGVPTGVELTGDYPSGIPVGTDFFFQFWVVDPDGAFGWAASNGLLGTADQLFDIISTGFDALLAAAAPPATSLPIYTTQDFSTQTYVRNPDCWAASVDLTALSPWNQLGANTRAGTLVSPRHIVFANHYALSFAPGNNDIVFVTADNVTVTRQVVGMAWAGGDIRVGVLDSDVPPEIGFVKVLPQNWPDYLWKAQRLPMLALDQEEKALVRDMVNLQPTFMNVSHTNPISPLRIPFTENLIGGDSGNPAFLIIDGEAVLILTHFTSLSGPFYTYWFDEVNEDMANLGGGYQLTEFDLGAYLQP